MKHFLIFIFFSLAIILKSSIKH